MTSRTLNLVKLPVKFQGLFVEVATYRIFISNINSVLNVKVDGFLGFFSSCGDDVCADMSSPISIARSCNSHAGSVATLELEQDEWRGGNENVIV